MQICVILGRAITRKRFNIWLGSGQLPGLQVGYREEATHLVLEVRPRILPTRLSFPADLLANAHPDSQKDTNEQELKDTGCPHSVAELVCDKEVHLVTDDWIVSSLTKAEVARVDAFRHPLATAAIQARDAAKKRKQRSDVTSTDTAESKDKRRNVTNREDDGGELSD